MKTLKYLMLLLAVAVALPAMAQATEMKKINKDDGMDTPLTLEADVVTGKLSAKNSFEVKKTPDGTLAASVISAQGTKHTLRMSPNGEVTKTCSGKSKGYCQHGYTYTEKDAGDDTFKPFEEIDQPVFRDKQEFPEKAVR